MTKTEFIGKVSESIGTDTAQAAIVQPLAHGSLVLGVHTDDIELDSRSEGYGIHRAQSAERRTGDGAGAYRTGV